MASKILWFSRYSSQEIYPEWLFTRKVFQSRRGIPYLDPLSRFRAVPPLQDGKRHLFHRRDTHINRRGNEVLGRALAEFLGDQIGATKTIEN